MLPARLQNSIAKLVLVGAFSVVAVLGAGQPFAFAKDSGFLGQIFTREKAAPVPPESVPSVAEPQLADTPSPVTPPKKKAPPKRKAVANAPLPPPRPWGSEDAPAPQMDIDNAALQDSSGVSIAQPTPEIRRGADETSTIPAPPTFVEPVEPARRDVALGAPASAVQAEPAPTPAPPPPDVAAGVEKERDTAAIAPPAPIAPPAASESTDTSSAIGTDRFDIAPECKAVVLVRKGAFKTAKLSTITVARGQIEDNSYAKLVADSIPGIHVNLRDMDWTSGLQSMALGEVDGVLVGVERQRPEELQQVWLGFYELVQLPLTDSEAWSCPRPAS